MVVVILFCLGLIFGSFASATVWRIHKQATLKSKVSKKERDELSITKGRSMCVHCKHELAAKDLIPLVSWLWLRGRCRYCKQKIDDSPLTEVAMGLLFVLSYTSWPYALSGVGIAVFGVWLAIIITAVILAVYDIRWYLLPNRVVYPFTGFAMIYVVLRSLQEGSWSIAVSSLIGGVLLFGLFYGLFQVSKGKWIGGGDVKLVLALGLLAGSLLQAALVLFAASLLGTLVSLPDLIRKRDMGQKVPFGPFLLAGTILIVLYGPRFAEAVLYM